MKQIYTKIVLVFMAILMCSAFSFAQQGKSLWTKTTLENTSNKELVYRKTEPKKAGFFILDVNALKVALQAAPNRKTDTGISNVVIQFPTANNTFESYRMKEAPIMEEELQNKYPDIRTYIGESIDNPGTVIRISITAQGLHTMSMSNNNGTQFIDPYTKGGNEYIVYSKRDLPLLDQPWECGVVDEVNIDENKDFDISTARNADDGLLRDFRLAIATTIEYSSFHWMAAGLTAGDTEAAKRAAVMAAVVVTINRNNQVYERDLSLTMTLVGNNDSIVFIDSDNFSNDNANFLINESQTVIDGAIGFTNYDIGHTFSTGGGGLAQLGSPCTGNKARGITGLGNPVGDAYDIDYVAHEIGHQFGAPHTFNGDAGSCAGGNRVASNAYEPGSGTTVMAYAGICAPQNVQNNSDAYFHQKSLQMIWDNITAGNSQCATTTNTGNNAPTSSAGVDYTIPISTPYKLTGSSTDADGTGSHTFTWEQYNLGTAGLPLETNTSGPMVRSYEGTSNPTRYIPRLEDILDDGGASTTWEKLPSVARNQAFRLTVRDNGAAGGQTAVDEMVTNVVAAAGPFLVTSQNTNQIVWTQGATETITWDVAGTDGVAVNAANVNILLSTDEGVTFNVIATNTPNDGSHDITVPNVTAPYCRIMVEAAGNIFFNVNDFFFAIGDYTYTTIDTCNDYPFNAGIAVPESTTSYSGYVLNIPDAANISDINIAVDFSHNNTGDLFYAFRYPEYAGTAVVPLASGLCDGSVDAVFVFDDEATGAINCASTGNGDFVTPQSPLSEADGTQAQGDWIFYIVDTAVGDGNTATWNSTTITVCTSEFTPILSIEDFDLESSFSVYPNPNSGEFNVKFNSSSNNVAISVFDIRGRSVYNKLFTNSGTFNEAINLGNVQSGMYLLNVNNGGRTITKKIIVK